MSPCPCPPIFVMGCQRSGTTLLARVLDSHSRIACPPETKFMAQLFNLWELEQPRQGLSSMGFSEADVLRRIRDFAAAFFEDYRTRKGKARWADKNNHYLEHLELLDRIFDRQARYIGIVRHGLDVVHSLVERDWGIVRRAVADGTPRHVACAGIWREQNERLLAGAERFGDRLHLVRYEALTRAPLAVLPELFAFLDEPFEPAVVEYGRFPHDAGFGDDKIGAHRGITPNSGGSAARPLAWRREVFEAARPMFERLGYGFDPSREAQTGEPSGQRPASTDRTEDLP